MRIKEILNDSKNAKEFTSNLFEYANYISDYEINELAKEMAFIISSNDLSSELIENLKEYTNLLED